jgi:hypothetical protein
MVWAAPAARAGVEVSKEEEEEEVGRGEVKVREERAGDRDAAAAWDERDKANEFTW